MGAISNDDLEAVTWQKCKRVGYTKILTAAVGYFSAYLRRSALVYQPIDSDATDYVRNEIDPMLRDVPAVREVLLTGPERKSKHNNDGQKGFVGATLHIRGGKSPRAYRRLTKDVVIYDELPAFDLDIGEGRGQRDVARRWVTRDEQLPEVHSRVDAEDSTLLPDREVGGRSGHRVRALRALLRPAGGGLAPDGGLAPRSEGGSGDGSIRRGSSSPPTQYNVSALTSPQCRVPIAVLRGAVVPLTKPGSARGGYRIPAARV